MTRRTSLPERLGHEPQSQECDIETLHPHTVILKVDQHLHKFHQYGLAMQMCEGWTPDYSDEIAQLRYLLDETLADMTQKPEDKIVWRHYYDLLNRAAFLEELTYAPLRLGATDESEEHIQQLINGTYGLNVHILADALGRYDNPAASLPERRQLRGIINELTSVALLNRSQETGYLALPAHYAADMHHKTDTIYYHRNNATPYATNIQVKSSPAEVSLSQTPENGILVTADDMSNRKNFATSRAIVAELYQNSDSATGDYQHLEDAHSTFMERVWHKIESGNARYAPHKTTTIGMSAPLAA